MPEIKQCNKLKLLKDTQAECRIAGYIWFGDPLI
jgi:hypothetical protein